MKGLKALYLVGILVAIDQYAKYLVETHLPYRQMVDIIPFISFFRTYNEGIAFSFMSGWNGNVLSLIVLAIIIFVTLMWLQLAPGKKFAHFGFAFIIGGAIANLIDRVLLGHVIDFILFHTPSWSFAVFNPADAFITIGAMLIILEEIITFRQNRNTPDDQ